MHEHVWCTPISCDFVTNGRIHRSHGTPPGRDGKHFPDIDVPVNDISKT
jgi:hypothetical protein